MKTAATVQKKRSRRSLSKTDRFTLATFVGIPTLLQIILLWVPAVVTIILSFTYWHSPEGYSMGRNSELQKYFLQQPTLLSGA